MLVSLQYSSLELLLLCFEVLTPDSELSPCGVALCPCKQDVCCICKYDKTGILSACATRNRGFNSPSGMDGRCSHKHGEISLCAAARRNAKTPDPTQRMTAQPPSAEPDAGHFAGRDWLGH
ncbi:hypothetical protein CI102_12584 [Trichoderma harzianum]|nr:hypothetical protein CI102_12584 [Trichoderma harzianum]